MIKLFIAKIHSKIRNHKILMEMARKKWLEKKMARNHDKNESHRQRFARRLTQRNCSKL